MVCFKILGYFKELCKEPIPNQPRLVNDPILAEGIPIGYFDGASKDDECGGCMSINIIEHHYFLLWLGCGSGSSY